MAFQTGEEGPSLFAEEVLCAVLRSHQNCSKGLRGRVTNRAVLPQVGTTAASAGGRSG